MSLLFPKITRPELTRMLKYAVLGALVAGIYGVIHDEITCTISPEYFTRLKFKQFSFADVGLPFRLHVAEIGFLASWWVGFIAAWLMARIAVPARWTVKTQRHQMLCGTIIVLVAALLGGIAGNFVEARWFGIDFIDWTWTTSFHEIKDVPAFAQVASIHNGTYLGGFIGLVISLILIARAKRRMRLA